MYVPNTWQFIKETKASQPTLRCLYSLIKE